MTKKRIKEELQTRYPNEKIVSIILDGKFFFKVVSISKLDFVWLRHYTIQDGRIIELKQQSMF